MKTIMIIIAIAVTASIVRPGLAGDLDMPIKKQIQYKQESVVDLGVAKVYTFSHRFRDHKFIAVRPPYSGGLVVHTWSGGSSLIERGDS